MTNSQVPAPKLIPLFEEFPVQEVRGIVGSDPMMVTGVWACAIALWALVVLLALKERKFF